MQKKIMFQDTGCKQIVLGHAPDVIKKHYVQVTGCRKQLICLGYQMQKVVYVWMLPDVESNLCIQATGCRKQFFRLPDVESSLCVQATG